MCHFRDLCRGDPRTRRGKFALLYACAPNMGDRLKQALAGRLAHHPDGTVIRVAATDGTAAGDKGEPPLAKEQ